MFKRTPLNWFASVALSVLLLAASAPGRAQSPSHPQWVGTWATAPMLADGGFHMYPFASVTLREIAHISAGGDQVRIRFTNEFNLSPLTISTAHVALSAGGSAIKDGSDHALTFGGSASVVIPPGAVIYSDPVALAVAPLSDVAVSFFLPAQVIRGETYHSYADQDNYMADGDQTASATLSNATAIQSWYFFDGIDVAAAEGSRAVIAIGDSITDGATSARNANHRWPDALAARLQQDSHLHNVSVLNVGIGGNRILNDSTGPNVLARIDRDVLAQNGARYIIVLEGINDIGRFPHPQGPEDDVTAERLELGLQQLADAAHQHGMKAIGATITPYGGAGYSSVKGEEVREAINNWIRSSGVFDGVADFDKATQDPQNPTHINPLYDSGDHLHPNDAGYQAMGQSIDLALFAR
jgi:lysophospholipase L1-like esterase